MDNNLMQVKFSVSDIERGSTGPIINRGDNFL